MLRLFVGIENGMMQREAAIDGASYAQMEDAKLWIDRACLVALEYTTSEGEGKSDGKESEKVYEGWSDTIVIPADWAAFGRVKA